MTTFQSENLFVGSVALALVPVIVWRILRGLRDGRLPIYRTYVSRVERPGGFRVMLALHGLALLLAVLISADLLLGLGLRSAP